MGYITWLLRSRSRNMLSPVRWERLIGHGQRW
jgi:Lipocalin-like domain